MTYRLATEADVVDIMRALLDLQAKSPAPHMKHTDPQTACQGILRAVGEERGFFFGGYFVLADHGHPWHSPVKYLIEDIVLKVHPEDTSIRLQYVINDGLEALARRWGCGAIVVGDTQIGYMTPLYHAAGFTTIGTQLYKEL